MKRKFLLTLPLACFALIGMTACGSDDIEENVIYAAPTGKETARVVRSHLLMYVQPLKN